MSSFAVSKEHIDVLVNALFQYRVVQPGADPNKLGRLLWEENHRSANYGGSDDEDYPTPDYQARTVEFEFDPVKLYAQIRCYGYQSCEHPAWESSVAARLIGELEPLVVAAMSPVDQACKRLSDRAEAERWPRLPSWPRFDNAPWGVTRCEEALPDGALVALERRQERAL